MMRKLINVTVLSLAFFCGVTLSFVYGADVNLSGFNIPVFDGAQDVWGDVENLEINGVATRAASFRAQSSITEVHNFYKGRLPGLGWKLDQVWPELSIISFTRDGNFLYVASADTYFAFSGRDTSSSNTKYILILSKRQLQLCFVTNPENLTSVKSLSGSELSFIPSYPKATRLLGIIREEKEAFFLYSIRDESAQIVDFYRKALAPHGWRPKQDINIPRTCVGAAASASVLFFERGKDTLVIYMNYLPGAAEGGKGGSNMVMISYNFSFSYMVNAGTLGPDKLQP